MGSSNSTPPSQPDGVTANAASHTLQQEVVTPRKESNGKTMIQAYPAHHELDRHARLGVPEFSGEQKPDVFLD